MIKGLKSFYNAMSEAFFLNDVARRYNDPEQMRRAVLKAMGVGVEAEAVNADERETERVAA